MPLCESAPVFVIVKLPPDWLMPARLKAAPLVSAILPEVVFVPLKLDKTLALLRVVPPTEVVTRVGPVRTPLWLIVLPEFAVKMPLKVVVGRAMAALV